MFFFALFNKKKTVTHIFFSVSAGKTFVISCKMLKYIKGIGLFSIPIRKTHEFVFLGQVDMRCVPLG